MCGELWAWAVEEPARAAVVAAVVGLPAVGLLAQQRQADQRKTGRAPVGASGGGVLGRYLTGRDLKPGEPASSASWWWPGVEVVRDRTAADIVTGGAELSRKEPAGRGGVLRALVAGAGRWGCWPGAARCAVRLGVPVAVVVGWCGWWAAVAAVVAVPAIAGVAVAVTGPVVLGWWRPRPASADLVHGPGMWTALRPVLGVAEGERRRRWLHMSEDVTEAGARIVLRLPAGWAGGDAGTRAVDGIVTGRLPGEWSARWHRTEASPYAEWTRKPPARRVPTLPEFVPWRSTGDPYQVYIGQAVREYDFEDVVIRTRSATPHFGVAGLTGSGKSTVLYLGLVHARETGVLVDILDTKQNSMTEAEATSGVRVHKTPAECVAALGEYITSMIAAETALGRIGDPALRELVVPRILIADELPTFMKMALIWWKYEIRGRGIPPFAEWFSIGLLQGRSSDHRFGIGAQQWANGYFGGTMERAQIGWKAQLGYCDYPSWTVAFGASTPVVSPDTRVPGRGVFSDGRINPETKGLWVREFQPSYITPVVSDRLSVCAPAPEWFDAGEQAPWITPEAMATAKSLAIPDFLVGGLFGPAAPVLGGPVTHRQGQGRQLCCPSSGVVTGGGVSGSVEGGASAPAAPGPLLRVELFNLSEACAAGILPWGYKTAKVYKSRSIARGIPFPDGVADGRVTYYMREDLTDWLARWNSAART